MQYCGVEVLFPLTQYTKAVSMKVTLHHLQRNVSSDVICCVMFSIGQFKCTPFVLCQRGII